MRKKLSTQRETICANVPHRVRWSDYDMNVADFHTANLGRNVIHKRVWHERLPTSPDFDELCKVWTDYQEELARHKAWKLNTKLCMNRGAYGDVHSTTIFSKARSGKYIHDKTDEQVERPDVNCRQFSVCSRERKHQENKRRIACSTKEAKVYTQELGTRQTRRLS